MPTVSVLMTAYNREKYIAEAIESVLASSFTDFELIIVDDCSTDATVEIAQRYLTDNRVQLHINKQNLGDYPNRNKAAEYAHGTYLKYVDSDDIIYPHGLAVMVDSMAQYPTAGLGLSRLVADYRPYPFQLTPEEAYTEHFLGNGLFANAPLSTIMRRQAFWDVGGFSGLRHVGDYEMWLKMAAQRPIVKMVAGLTWWRSHNEQEANIRMTLLKYPPKLEYHVNTTALAEIDCPLSTVAQVKAIQKLRTSHARQILSFALKSRRPQFAYRLFRELDLVWSDLIRGGFHV